MVIQVRVICKGYGGIFYFILFVKCIDCQSTFCCGAPSFLSSFSFLFFVCTSFLAKSISSFSPLFYLSIDFIYLISSFFLFPSLLFFRSSLVFSNLPFLFFLIHPSFCFLIPHPLVSQPVSYSSFSFFLFPIHSPSYPLPYHIV